MFNDAFDGGKKEVGAKCVLEVPTGSEIPVTNVSFDEEANTSEVQFTGDFHQDIAVTGVSYSGSFEIAGSNEEARGRVWDEGNNDYGTTLPNHISVMTIKHEDGNWAATFTNVLLNSRSKDIPSDDRTTDSYDFMAEKMNYE